MFSEKKKHDYKKNVVFGSAFLAGAFVFWQKHDREKVVVSRSAFLAGDFILGKT